MVAGQLGAGAVARADKRGFTGRCRQRGQWEQSFGVAAGELDVRRRRRALDLLAEQKALRGTHVHRDQRSVAECHQSQWDDAEPVRYATRKWASASPSQ